MTLSCECSLYRARTQIARVLLEQAAKQPAKRHQLAQRDMASRGGIDWKAVHASLDSLENEGAIRVERNRIIINKKLLNKLAAAKNS